jgi:hypothetical protein
MPKGEREYVDLEGAARGFWFFCVCSFMHHVYFFALALYDMCTFEILL